VKEKISANGNTNEEEYKPGNLGVHGFPEESIVVSSEQFVRIESIECLKADSTPAFSHKSLLEAFETGCSIPDSYSTRDFVRSCATIQLDLEGGDQFSLREVELQSKRGRVILIATESEMQWETLSSPFWSRANF
jgi:hypothetical protein